MNELKTDYYEIPGKVFKVRIDEGSEFRMGSLVFGAPIAPGADPGIYDLNRAKPEKTGRSLLLAN
jgi:hypothetical protein